MKVKIKLFKQIKMGQDKIYVSKSAATNFWSSAFYVQADNMIRMDLLSEQTEVVNSTPLIRQDYTPQSDFYYTLYNFMTLLFKIIFMYYAKCPLCLPAALYILQR